MHILLTGGGTGGHVIPNLAIARAITAHNPVVKLSYMGSYHGPEKQLVQEAGLPYYRVLTGKWRRYFDLRNVIDLFKIPLGIFQAWLKMHAIKPDVIFSKGGFVAVPVVLAAHLHRIPILIHESDSNLGLTTRITAPYAWEIFCAYDSSREILKKKYPEKVEKLGNPVRENILHGNVAKAKKRTGFSGKKPVLLVMGGSTGAQQVNDWVLKEKEALTQNFDVIHLTGEGKGRAKKEKAYYAQAFAKEELADFYALASCALSRAGAGALAELEALRLPSLLLPLGLKSSRGDQVINAKAKVKEHSFFKLAKPKQNLVKQLQKLPKRSKKKDSHCKVTEQLAQRLLAYL